MSKPLDILRKTQESVNPALRLAWELQIRQLRGAIDLLALVEVSAEIDAYTAHGARLAQESDATLKRLRQAQAQPARFVPTGF